MDCTLVRVLKAVFGFGKSKGKYRVECAEIIQQITRLPKSECDNFVYDFDNLFDAMKAEGREPIDGVHWASLTLISHIDIHNLKPNQLCSLADEIIILLARDFISKTSDVEMKRIVANSLELYKGNLKIVVNNLENLSTDLKARLLDENI